MNPGLAVVVETVLLAEDGSGDVVVRLYEALGGPVDATLRTGFPAGAGVATDLLEWAVDGRPVTADDGRIALTLRPFELVTLRIARSEAPRR